MKLDHIAINVKNISESLKYYIQIGAKTLYYDETWAMIEMGESKIALTTKSEHKPHIAFRVLSEQDVSKFGKVKSHRDGSLYTYCEDFDGNTIEWIYYPDKVN